jgi:oligopeptide/dipeptide ABC transporter ATP-binding protein
MTVRDLIAEPLKTYKVCGSKEETTERVLELMKAVGVPGEFLHRYPHQFSGGQRQRIGIARAIAADPDLIICDEPVSALDVSIQAQIINLLIDLQAKRGLTYLFIAHDLSVVRHISDRIAVMYLGRVVEISPWDKLYERPLHPYTKALLSAIPIPDPVVEKARERTRITGEVPSLMNRPTGCVFHPRCPYATEQCSKEVPPLVDYDGHKCACFKAAEINKL